MWPKKYFLGFGDCEKKKFLTDFEKCEFYIVAQATREIK